MRTQPVTEDPRTSVRLRPLPPVEVIDDHDVRVEAAELLGERGEHLGGLLDHLGQRRG